MTTEEQPWIERRANEPKPSLPRNAMVELEHRNDFRSKQPAAMVLWRWGNISSDVMRYRVLPKGST